MAYRLANPPADAQRWIVDEFRKIEQAWATGMDKIRLDPQYAAPEKPRDGMILVADGTTWNPGLVLAHIAITVPRGIFSDSHR